MKLYEYQGREVFARYDIPTPTGVVVERPEELDGLADQLTFPVVVKAQVLVGGRGKAGGVKFADDLAEAKARAGDILGMDIKGLTVHKVFVVQKLDFAREFYMSVTLDRSTRELLMLFSTEGGVDIESVADEKIRRVRINPLTGFTSYHARELLEGTDLAKDPGEQVVSIAQKLVAAYLDQDAELLEINPLAVTTDGQVLAADAKVIIDPDASFRHPEFEAPAEEKTPLEREAEAQGISFIQLDGDIGIIANGAGLTMATLDAITHYGGAGGVFLDLGGTDDAEKVRACVTLMKKAKPKVMLLNLFGGITKSDTVAKGLKMVLDEEPVDFPIVTRIKGVNEDEARAILKEAGLHTADTLQDAARLTVELTKGGA